MFFELCAWRNWQTRCIVAGMQPCETCCPMGLHLMAGLQVRVLPRTIQRTSSEQCPARAQARQAAQTARDNEQPIVRNDSQDSDIQLPRQKNAYRPQPHGGNNYLRITCRRFRHVRPSCPISGFFSTCLPPRANHDKAREDAHTEDADGNGEAHGQTARPLFTR